MIRWKVVTTSRTSTFASGKYCLEYPKGEVVKAPPQTLGIMVFKWKGAAEHYQQEVGGFSEFTSEIIRVKGIGRGKTPNKIGANPHLEKALDVFYGQKCRRMGVSPWPDSICYPAVEILD